MFESKVLEFHVGDSVLLKYFDMVSEPEKIYDFIEHNGLGKPCTETSGCGVFRSWCDSAGPQW